MVLRCSGSMSTPALPGHGSFEWKKKRKQTHSGAVRHRPLPELTDDSFVVELNEEVDELHGSVVDVIGNRAYEFFENLQGTAILTCQALWEIGREHMNYRMTEILNGSVLIRWKAHDLFGHFANISSVRGPDGGETTPIGIALCINSQTTRVSNCLEGPPSRNLSKHQYFRKSALRDSSKVEVNLGEISTSPSATQARGAAAASQEIFNGCAGATAKAAARNTTRITPEEATYKLLNVRKVAIGAGGVPHIVTHDGRTIRYPDPAIQVNDTVKYDLNQAKLVDFVKFDTGNMCVITGGRNMGRAGVIVHREKHIGGFDIVHVKDSLERTFATRRRVTNIFVIGDGPKPWISLPKGKGTNLTISEERDLKRKRAAEH
ncbi:ribosomal family S4e-domain-containing protein [Mycena metata]|uniref:Ribosomal family S4e-domain-containing protein n=1 Tax=Mycena metata TaxID=1033252 RepID=A0AAD7DZ51_9AGAR|nr:ribosomal family S4e-domain-containing protein [Mycena metata]